MDYSPLQAGGGVGGSYRALKAGFIESSLASLSPGRIWEIFQCLEVSYLYYDCIELCAPYSGQRDSAQGTHF